MLFPRYRKNSAYITWLLAAAVLLRTFIAPGYMLAASADAGLRIIFCEGPVAVESGQKQHAGHQHGSEHANEGEIHISPICSQWSTSSLLVLNVVVIPLFPEVFYKVEKQEYEPRFYQSLSNASHAIRAPPSLV